MKMGARGRRERLRAMLADLKLPGVTPHPQETPYT